MSIEYIQNFPYACIDKQNFVTDEQIQNLAKTDSGLQGAKLSSAYKNLKAAFKVKSLWNTDQYPVLNVSFLDGTPEQQAWVKTVIDKNLQPLITKFKFNWGVDPQQSHIRISFKLPGQAWSVLGNEALNIPKNQPTMNLGWLDNNVSFGSEKFKNTGQVVMHEFGHAIGMIHEHQNPKGNPIKWNKQKVSEDLKRTNGWSQEQIDHNMFAKYGDYELCEEAKKNQNMYEIKNYCLGEIVNGSTYDIFSIMNYMFPTTWIEGGIGQIPANTVYSDMDKKWIKKYYGDGITETFINLDNLKNNTTGYDVCGLLLIVIYLVLYILIRKN
jgi:hypothetical protein